MPCRLSIARMLIGVLTCAGITACAAVGPRIAAPADTVVFPDPGTAAIKGGIFVGADQLGKVGTGMSKPQVYAVLGVSHFNEGVSSGAREWNYLFNVRDSDDQVQQCQFMLQFDENDRVVTSHWKPATCEARMHSEAPVTPPMATWTKPAPVVAPAPVPAPQPAATAPVTLPAGTPSAASLPATTPLPVAAPSPVAAPQPVAITPSASMPIAPVSLSSDAAFSSGSSRLSAAGRERLDSMLLQVQFPTELHAIHIVGFSDRIGTKRGNLRLSQQRANAVRTYLIEGGVPADQVTAEGRGAVDPQVQCTQVHKKALAECLAPNRRVEITGMSASSTP